MPDPQVTYDFEFGLTSGELLFVPDVLMGRDTIAKDDERIRIERHPDPQTTEETVVSRADCAYTRIIQRTEEPTFENTVLDEVERRG